MATRFIIQLISTNIPKKTFMKIWGIGKSARNVFLVWIKKSAGIQSKLRVNFKLQNSKKCSKPGGLGLTVAKSPFNYDCIDSLDIIFLVLIVVSGRDSKNLILFLTKFQISQKELSAVFALWSFHRDKAAKISQFVSRRVSRNKIVGRHHKSFVLRG